MTIEELRRQMKACRCVYRGSTKKLDAYKKNLKRINIEVEYGKYGKYLHKYNATLFNLK